MEITQLTAGAVGLYATSLIVQPQTIYTRLLLEYTLQNLVVVLLSLAFVYFNCSLAIERLIVSLAWYGGKHVE